MSGFAREGPQGPGREPAWAIVDLIDPRSIVRPLAAQYMTTLRRGPVFGSTGPNQKPGTRSMRDVVFAHGFWTQDRWPIARSPETVSEWVVYETQSAQRNTDIPAHQGCRARRGITPGATLRAGGRSPTRVRKDQRIGRLAIRVRLEAGRLDTARRDASAHHRVGIIDDQKKPGCCSPDGNRAEALHIFPSR